MSWLILDLQGCPYRLELRQTQNKGWALYTLDFIPAGTFVIEYTGLIRHQTTLNESSARSSGRGSDSMQADQGGDAASNNDEYAFDMEPRPGCDDMHLLPLLPPVLDRWVPCRALLPSIHTPSASEMVDLVHKLKTYFTEHGGAMHMYT